MKDKEVKLEEIEASPHTRLSRGLCVFFCSWIKGAKAPRVQIWSKKVAQTDPFCLYWNWLIIAQGNLLYWQKFKCFLYHTVSLIVHITWSSQHRNAASQTGRRRGVAAIESRRPGFMCSCSCRVPHLQDEYWGADRRSYEERHEKGFSESFTMVS